MSAAQAVCAMRNGVLSVMPEAECVGLPMADGGEGTVDAVVDALDGRRIVVDVEDPLGRVTGATYGYVPHRRLAVIEIAAAAGIELVAPPERDVLGASSFGVGELISFAMDHGATDILRRPWRVGDQRRGFGHAHRARRPFRRCLRRPPSCGGRRA